jgi:hypothetical protein
MRRFNRTVAIGVALGLTVAIGLPATAAAQQTAAIRGTVTDSTSGAPIVGAQVTVVGTTRGAITNDHGAYLVVQVPAGAATVRAQRIGFAPDQHAVTLTAGDTATVNFVLHSVATTLSEVVVVGYGTENRARVTGAVSTVSGTDVTPGLTQNPGY